MQEVHERNTQVDPTEVPARTGGMRTRVLLGALALVAAAPGSAGQAASNCGSALPAAPAGLPAPVVFRTSCGTYRADEHGTVSRTRPVRSPWWSPSRFQIAVRDDHVVVVERGRVRWRSKRPFFSAPSEFDSVAFAPHELAFSFIHGRLWVSRFDGHEHAVGWSEGALVWTSRGDLLTLPRRHGHFELAVRDGQGLHPRVIARRLLNYALVDDATRTVLYVNASRTLVRTDGRSKQFLANLGALGFGPKAALQALPGGMVGLSSEKRLAVLRRDGSVFARTDFPAAPAGQKHGWTNFAAGRDRVAAAVELSDRDGTGGEDVLVVRAGATSGRLLAREQSHWAGCGWIVTLAWRGDWLLYSDSVVDVLAFDTDGSGRIELSATAQRLPGVRKDEETGQPVGLDFAVWG
jgi:hypothetical protein